jgi:hypothetical protein
LRSYELPDDAREERPCPGRNIDTEAREVSELLEAWSARTVDGIGDRQMSHDHLGRRAARLIAALLEARTPPATRQ